MRLASLVLLPLLALTACTSAVLPPLTVTSPAFAEGGSIPLSHTCDGRNVAPPLAIAGLPRGAKALGVIMRDLDAQGAPAVHWVMWNADKTALSWAEDTLPAGALEAQNSAGFVGYSGPCRAIDKPHRYEFAVYAFDAPLQLKAGAATAEIEKAFVEHALAKGTLTGLYGQSLKAASGAVL
ncbi:MAG: YbhB/YbcL family Raf kinase inhibitor-like protein [Candidatus Peribacteraceae bacterium]|nr:YbhB/YbcL family Raf kinase inhibitor-like protein [Candidatus Peribacteraceae bacterium]